MKYIYLIGFFCCCELCTAQQIVSNGGFEIKSNISINWIIGGDLTNIIDIGKSVYQPTNENLTEHQEDLRIFPNPAKDFLIIESQNIDTGKVVIEIYDNQGKKLESNSLMANSYLRMDISEIPSGIYILKICLSRTRLPLIGKFIKY